MGCCFSEEEDPQMRSYRAAKSFGDKARIILSIATRQEKNGRIVSAITSYGTYLRCMAVHCFKEFDRRKRDELLNVAQSCRRITTHRAGLQRKAVQLTQGACCSDAYIPTDPAAPALLSPWEWNEWLAMCKGAGDIEAALKKMGLLKMESKETVALRVAEASRPTTNVSLALNNQVNPNINVAPTINVAGPTNTNNTNIAGPTTNVAGPTTSTNINPNLSNAQTGEGNVAPATGSAAAGAAAASAAGGHVAAPATPMGGMGMGMGMQQPGMGGGMQQIGMGMQQNGMGMGMQQPFMMMPNGSGGFVPVMVPGGGMGGLQGAGGSGDMAAQMQQAQQAQQLQAQQAQLLQQQQQMMMMMHQQSMNGGSSGGMGFMPPGGMMPQVMPTQTMTPTGMAGMQMPMQVPMQGGYMMAPAGSGGLMHMGMAPNGGMPAGYPQPTAPGLPGDAAAPPPTPPVTGVPAGKTV